MYKGPFRPSALRPSIRLCPVVKYREVCQTKNDERPVGNITIWRQSPRISLGGASFAPNRQRILWKKTTINAKLIPPGAYVQISKYEVISNNKRANQNNCVVQMLNQLQTYEKQVLSVSIHPHKNCKTSFGQTNTFLNKIYSSQGILYYDRTTGYRQ